MDKGKLFSYSWHIDEKEEDITCIRIYGLNEKNENLCIRIDNFTPYVYLELPQNIEWNTGKAQLVSAKLDNELGENKPLKKCFMMKKKLYGVRFDNNGSRMKYPYLFCSFSSKKDIKMLGYKLRKGFHIAGLGLVRLKIHESDADPILQLTCCKNIYTAGWIEFGGKLVCKSEQITLCDYEYKVSWKNIKLHDDDNIPNPKIMGFDIEVNSGNPCMMPNPKKPGDKIFQISCVMSIHNRPSCENVKYLLSLGDPDQYTTGGDVIIYRYFTESDLLEGFTELIRTENPNIIVGYNILGFDIPYMIERAKLNMCIFSYDQQGFHKCAHAKERTIKWSSSAYKNQEFQFLDAEGRLYVDLLPLVRRDYKFNNYKLKTISEYFLKDETKDPLSVKGIFKCYRIGTCKNLEGSYSKRAQKALGICGKYCVKDSELVVLLMDKLQTWVGLAEMAKTCQVPIFTLYTQGQQIKVYSQIYKYCMKHDIVVEKDGYEVTESERYMGAHVFPPVPGKYKMVIPFDFCLSGNTLISMGNGLCKKLDCIDCDITSNILSCKNNKLVFDNIVNGLQYKGVKKTIKIVLSNNETIICTPDHKFLLKDGSWCKAQYLKNKIIKRGILFPEDKLCYNERNWNLSISFLELNMLYNREKILAFFRILGYVFLKQRIIRHFSLIYVRFTTFYDANIFRKDLLYFCSNILIEKEGIMYRIKMPQILLNIYISINNFDIYSVEINRIPNILLKDDCPRSVVREFVGGLYGGSISKGIYLKEDKFSLVFFELRYSVSKCEVDKFLYNFENLLKSRFDINVIISRQASNKNDLIFNNFEVLVNLGDDKDCNKFTREIGFRYEINKSFVLDIRRNYQYNNNNIDIKKYLNELGLYENYRLNVEIGIDTLELPVYNQKVVCILDNEDEKVYDIEVKKNHNFLGNGIVVHNCSLYPTTIIAYNIDYHSWVPDDVEIEDSKCHIMRWSEHINCIVEGTPITIGEYCVKIEDLYKYREKLLSYNEEKTGMSYFTQTNFFNQGIKECVKLILEDGTELYCTPEHKIMTQNGWIEAQNIPLNTIRIFTSYNPPIFEIGNKELIFDDMVFSGKKLIKFFKILGLLCSDSYISHNRTRLYCGHPIDLDNLKRDIEDLCPNSVSVSKQNYGWGITILGKLGKIFSSIEGICIGNKHKQTRSLPTILNNISKGELCAFFSGLFGGDGHTFSYSEKAHSIGTIAFAWSSEFPEQLIDVFCDIQKYLKLCGINSNIKRYRKTTYLYIKSSDILLYKEYIGFSYCVHKSMRLELGYSYLKLRDNIWKQQKWLVDKVKLLKKSLTLEKAVNLAIEELYLSFPIYNEYYSKPSVKQMIELMRSRKKWDKPMFLYKYFPTFPNYIESLGCSDIFNSYGVDIDKDILPIIYKKLIYIEYIGKKQVYDLEVSESHSFVANGIVVHNCIHDPKIIRYNTLSMYIDKEKAVIKKLREKRNKTCGVLNRKEIMDEINAKLYDLKPYIKERSEIAKTKGKNVMCNDNRYYRFLKEPKGVLPTILQNLLDARKKTRKVDMLRYKERIKKLSDVVGSEEEIANCKSILNVLDKRQLAYKISANSMYGAMGVKKGYLPFMPGAMVTTMMGRKNIEIVAKTIVEQYEGELIYGDTDSNYIYFPKMQDKTIPEIWDYAEYVADEISKLFPPPINFWSETGSCLNGWVRHHLG